MKLKKMKPQVLRSELESCLQQLDTQTRVARQLEYERDRANDDSDFAKVGIECFHYCKGRPYIIVKQFIVHIHL